MDQEIATSDTTLAFDFAIAASEKKNLHNHNTTCIKERFFFSLFPFVQRLRVSKLDSLFHLATCNFFIRMGLQDAPNKEKLEGKLPPRPDSPCMLRPEHVAPAAEDASEVQ